MTFREILLSRRASVRIALLILGVAAYQFLPATQASTAGDVTVIRYSWAKTGILTAWLLGQRSVRFTPLTKKSTRKNHACNWRPSEQFYLAAGLYCPGRGALKGNDRSARNHLCRPSHVAK